MLYKPVSLIQLLIIIHLCTSNTLHCLKYFYASKQSHKIAKTPLKTDTETMIPIKVYSVTSMAACKKAASAVHLYMQLLRAIGLQYESNVSISRRLDNISLSLPWQRQNQAVVLAKGHQSCRDSRSYNGCRVGSLTTIQLFIKMIQTH